MWKLLYKGKKKDKNVFFTFYMKWQEETMKMQEETAFSYL